MKSCRYRIGYCYDTINKDCLNKTWLIKNALVKRFANHEKSKRHAHSSKYTEKVQENLVSLFK